MLVLLLSLAIANDLLVDSVTSLGGVKNDGSTRIVLLSQAEEILSQDAKVSSSRYTHSYSAIHPDHVFNFSKLLGDAELVHSKLEPILRSLYFRIFRISLDSPCRLRERNDVCAGAPEDGISVSLDKDVLGGVVADECVPKCYVGRCQPYEFAEGPSLDGLEHFVLRYPNEPESKELDPKDLYSNNMWYKDILGLYPQRVEDTVYVDLQHNPPSYTAYKGGNDWKEIYDLQCDNEDDVPCNQTEHFYRLISGMQASVAAWAAWNHKCVNTIAAYQLKKELPRYVSNPDFYKRMLGDYPDRLENMYYTFQAMLKTVCRLTPFLTGFAENLREKKEYEYLYRNLVDLLSADYDMCKHVEVSHDRHACEECQSSHAPDNNTQLKDPRLLEKFNNISDLIDCLGCEKCRLHGKLKLTALQIIVRASGRAEQLMLERNEIVALLHALDYFAQSIIFVQKFKEQRKRNVILFPIRVVVTLVLILAVMYRKELRRALFQCSRREEEHADENEEE